MSKIFTYIIKILSFIANLFGSHKDNDYSEDTSEIASEDTTDGNE